MQRIALAVLALFLTAAASPVAAQTGLATTADLQRLQDDLDNLDDSLADLRSDHPREAALRQRAETIRERVDRLTEDVRRARREGGSSLGVSRSDVQALRRDIAALQRDVDTAAGRTFGTGSAATLPEGTEIQVRLEQPLSSKTARQEDRVETTVAVPVRVDGRVVIPAGTRVRGVVRAVQSAERPARGGRLDLEFDSIYPDDRTRVDLRGRVVSIQENVDRSETGKRAGIGAVLGGVLGSIIGGTKGALIGLVIGGAGGVVATAGEEVELPEGAILTVRLERPLDLRR